MMTRLSSPHLGGALLAALAFVLFFHNNAPAPAPGDAGAPAHGDLRASSPSSLQAALYAAAPSIAAAAAPSCSPAVTIVFVYASSSSPPPPNAAKPGACVSAQAARDASVAFMTPRMTHGQNLGQYDSAVMAPLLRPFFDGATPTLIIDVGANTGDTSAGFVPLFTDVDCLRYHKRRPPTGPHVACTHPPLRVFAYEPMPENFEILELRGREEAWADAGWRAFQIAATSRAALAASSPADGGEGHGRVKFFARVSADGKRVGGDQQGGVVKDAAEVDTFVLVDSWTLDAHLASIGEHDTRILLLKVDTEGFDGQVLRGAEGILARQLARFIVFEYNSKWHYQGGDTLAGVVSWLADLKYACHWIAADRLVPLSGKFWHPSYEFWEWSNVFCFAEGDARAAAVVTFYNAAASEPAPPVVCE